MTRRFRKKPVEIEALQFDGHNYDQVVAWIDSRTDRSTPAHSPAGSLDLYIETLEGTMHASPGDYIIRGLQGEFYPCKPDIFEQTYDPIEEGQ